MGNSEKQQYIFFNNMSIFFIDRQEAFIYMKSFIKLFWITFISVSIISGSYVGYLLAQGSYEDYRKEYKSRRDYQRKRRRIVKERYRYNRPLSEMKTGERKQLLQDLRHAIRNEIDQSISKERRANKKKINEDKLISQVRKIIRQEIDEAIKLKDKNYMRSGTFEVGGFVAMQTKGLEGSSSDNNFIVKLFPTFNYFVVRNLALGLKGEAEFNFTTKKNNYNAGVGPQFVFGLTSKNDLCFYASIFAGYSYNDSIEENSKYGYRYGNEIGFKLVMSSGVIISLGGMIIFDNAGRIEGFQNILVPALGITAWF